MKREYLIKGIAAGVTVLFLAAVRPDPTPTPVEWGVVAILMYECLSFSMNYIRKVNHKKKAAQYLRVSRADMRRWADEQLYWPLHEEVI
jgi:hypothetical protein